MNCKKCGTVLNSEDKVCSNCGEPVNLDESISKQKDLEEEKRNNNKNSNNILIIILVFILLVICGFLIYAFIIKYTNNEVENNKSNIPNNSDNVLDNNIENDNNQNNNEVNYVLNNQISNAYEPITTTRIKTEDTGIIMEIDSNKNVGYYFENCGQNCESTTININGEHAKYVTISSYGVAAMYHYIILTEEGNIYKGSINHTIVEEAKKIESDNKFVNITNGGDLRVEQSQKSKSVLGITSENDYYDVIYCPNVKSGNYLAYSYYSDISDVNNTKSEYVLIYNDGFLSYLSITEPFDAQRCDNYNYNQYIVNSNNEKIQAQVVLYNNGFYILGTDGYLYKLSSTKNGDNYVADLYSSKKVENYSYEQGNAYIRSITFEYDDKTDETIEDVYGNVQIVMVEK